MWCASANGASAGFNDTSSFSRAISDITAFVRTHDHPHYDFAPDLRANPDTPALVYCHTDGCVHHRG